MSGLSFDMVEQVIAALTIILGVWLISGKQLGT
jgi:hydrogenase/urease accessory protein HupE